MKRNHRQWHRLIWLVLTPLAAVVIGLALLWRLGESGNNELPATLLTPITQGRG